MSTIRFVADNGDTEDIVDIDPHFYEKQVPASSPFSSNAFALAAAIAKDRARVQLVKAVRTADLEGRSTGFGLSPQGFSNGVLIDPRSSNLGIGQPGVLIKRSIDGVDGAPDDAIKL